VTKQASVNNSEVVRRLIDSLALKVSGVDNKPGIADLVRLLQLEKELEPDEPREVIVRWVEPLETASTTKI
jgi:hypothetical protein